MMAEAVDLSAAGVTLAKTWTPAVALSSPGSSAFVSTAPGCVGRYTKVGGVLVAQFQAAVTVALGTGAGYLKISGPADVIPSGSTLPAEVMTLASGYVTQHAGLALPSGYGGLVLGPLPQGDGRGLDFAVFASPADGGIGELLGAAQLTNGVDLVLNGTFIYWLS